MMDQPFQLAPVPIGEPHPPRQTYCLRNGGPAELHYSINTAPLQQLVTSNYSYEVSCCWGGGGGVAQSDSVISSVQHTLRRETCYSLLLSMYMRIYECV